MEALAADRAEVLVDEFWKVQSEDELSLVRRHFDELRAEIEAERPVIDVPEETGWLVETTFGPHIHYMGIQDPHPHWRETKSRDEEWSPYGRRALVGMLSFNKDSNDGLRFARKVDAEAFIAAFGQLLTDPKATEHQWVGPSSSLTTRAGVRAKPVFSDEVLAIANKELLSACNLRDVEIMQRAILGEK